MKTTPLTRKVIVRNPLGLHLRPANLLVKLANQFESDILIGIEDANADCKSILSLMTLGAEQGTELCLSAEGIDAAQALESINELFDAGFFDETEEVEKES